MKNEHSNAFQLDLFESLPNKPYCTDELGVTVIRSKKIAIKKKYIQVNRPLTDLYLVFDLDYAYSALAWSDLNLPSPTWVSKNPVNGHCHIAYSLQAGVCTSSMARLAPLKYLAAIQSAYTQKLKADRSYARLLTKNPLHDAWQTTWWADEKYTLDYLADFVDLTGHPLKGKECHGLGRNCELFENVAHWAYREIRKYWSPDYESKWKEAVLSHTEALNAQFIDPLPYSEVKSISKSIANYVIRHFSPERFRESQAKKGSKGGKVSKGGGRPSLNEPWKELGISRATYFRKKKADLL
ncbi:replication initiation protein [Photobacterium phosphoreum]|uniref:replication initiation protein n=1 Tax=Photobacterium phosphoreum TaxID=659 RepID=UPI000D15F84C|nr:replication initiation protein [Photobacterium phosphoreum]PTB30963.1 RepA protein [Photobacterium phosphoreum]